MAPRCIFRTYLNARAGLIRPIQIPRPVRTVLVVGKILLEYRAVFMLPFDSTFLLIALFILTDTGLWPRQGVYI